MSVKKGKPGRAKTVPGKREADYRHPEAQSPLRPEVGTQAQFKKKKPPATYRYDSSLAPELRWDGQNPAREEVEAVIRDIDQTAANAMGHFEHLAQDHLAESAAVARARGETKLAEEIEKCAELYLGLKQDHLVAIRGYADQLRRMSRPFLNWTGKAERLSFDVPTLPLFVHERLSTKAIIETLKSHEKRAAQADMFELFGDPRRSVADQTLKAYEYKDEWVNRLILGDSLVVMNSLLHYEGLGGQVQMIYIDPPYGVKFGSNFQPFVRDPEVLHNNDKDMTREPEMVKAYRDTWELGLHSYLTYLRDRLLLARDLLHSSGSVFVQISDENLHHVRELMDEIFGSENFCAVVTFRKKQMPLGSDVAEAVSDYLVWYARNRETAKLRPIYKEKAVEGDASWSWVELADGTRRKLSRQEIVHHDLVPVSARIFQPISLLPAQYRPNQDFPFDFEGVTYRPPKNSCWKTDLAGMTSLAKARRLHPSGNTLRYVLYHSDYPVARITNLWADTGGADDPIYVVQTNTDVVKRCMLMTTDPGDLVLDPTCGSGTTAFVAEKWGRRWITVDTSRVPLALARQRLLTATFPYYELKDDARGPAGGFVYKRRQNKKGEEVGGIVPHVTLKSIANNEPPQEEVLVDRPETLDNIVRVAGPFAVEATIPSPIDLDGDGAAARAAGDDSGAAPEEHATYLERMLEVLRKSPLLQLGGGKTVTLRNIRPPAKSLSLSAEAMVEANGNGKRGALAAAIDAAHEANTGGLRFSQRPVAIAFGPESGAVSEKLVQEALREAYLRHFTHLYVIGFAIQANARELIEKSEAIANIPSTYVQATPDLMMGELLKTTRASQIFSVCGMPEIGIGKLAPEKEGGPPRYQVELLGYDVFDPATMELDHKNGDDVPAWMLDTDYNGLVFHGSQVFFPRTSAWESLKKALKATHEESVWDHLAGSTSAPFEAGEHATIAVKVIDDRGNELLVVKNLKDAA